MTFLSSVVSGGLFIKIMPFKDLNKVIIIIIIIGRDFFFFFFPWGTVLTSIIICAHALDQTALFFFILIQNRTRFVVDAKEGNKNHYSLFLIRDTHTHTHTHKKGEGGLERAKSARERERERGRERGGREKNNNNAEFWYDDIKTKEKKGFKRKKKRKNRRSDYKGFVLMANERAALACRGGGTFLAPVTFAEVWPKKKKKTSYQKYFGSLILLITYGNGVLNKTRTFSIYIHYYLRSMIRVLYIHRKPHSQ